MKTLEETYLDRSEWLSGEWDNEPDKRQWLDEGTGFPCLIVRNTLGNLCGYVGVSDTHPAYEKDYDDVPADVHGGLTYSDKCGGKVCHVVEPGEDDNVWWLGFDCAHLNDFVPKRSCESFSRDIYRNIDYVKQQCECLASQLALMGTDANGQ